MQRSKNEDRSDLLADVAEMYYLEGLKQSDIARRVGVTRSMVSRMLSEAQQQGIVEINIRRALRVDRDLTDALTHRFGLHSALVVANRYSSSGQLLSLLGAGAAQLLAEHLRPQINVGVVWGTTMNAVVEALLPRDLSPIHIVQLSGALGSRHDVYDAHAIVRRMALKLGGEYVYLNAPLFVEDAEMVASLTSTRGVREAIQLARDCDIALLGIGGVDPQSCAYYITNHISLEQLSAFVKRGAVGVVYGYFFDQRGRVVDTGYYDQIIGIHREELLRIPMRTGIAGGMAKARAIAGALEGGFINSIVTDSQVATQVLEGFG